MFEHYDGIDAIAEAWREGLTPDPLLSVSEWADQYRFLSGKSASEPGRWRTSRTPYLKEIMDCLSPTSPVERVVFMKGAQVGGTECGNNWIGYVIHMAPGPMMAVAPTVEMAKRNSKQRIDPLIEESETLSTLIAPARARDSGNTILTKEFRGGVLVLTGANSAVGLRSMPVRYLFLDEIDAYPGDAGADLRSDENVTIPPGERRTVSTGTAIALPDGFVGLVHPRSGLAAKHGVTVLNAPGTVDAAYRGEIKVTLLNTDLHESFEIKVGDRIAQLIIQAVEKAQFIQVDHLPESHRGEGGFGSTGVK